MSGDDARGGGLWTAAHGSTCSYMEDYYLQRCDEDGGRKRVTCSAFNVGALFPHPDPEATPDDTPPPPAPPDPHLHAPLASGPSRLWGTNRSRLRLWRLPAARSRRWTASCGNNEAEGCSAAAAANQNTDAGAHIAWQVIISSTGSVEVLNHNKKDLYMFLFIHFKSNVMI